MIPPQRWWRALAFALPAVVLVIASALVVRSRLASRVETQDASRAPAPAPALLAPPPSPVLTAASLAPEAMPILHSQEWEFGFARRMPEGVRSAHYSTLSDGVFFCTASGAIARLDLATGTQAVVVPNAAASFLTTSTDGRWLAWSIGSGKGALGRAAATAPWTELPRLKQTAPDQDDDPKGVTFIRLGWNGAAPLQRGDFIVTDAGYQGRKGIWRFRCDRDAPPEQIVANPEMLGDPVDVTCTMSSVFVANRVSKRATSEPVLPEDYTRRILRLEGRQLIACRTDLPIADPSAITVLQGKLYVLTGHQLGGEPHLRQLLELAPTGKPDHYSVRVILSHLAHPSDAGLDVSERGLLISDEGAKMLYELRRK